MNTDELWIQFKMYGDRTARDELILQYIGYAEALAATEFRKDNHGFTYDEILSNAYLGLIDAVERYAGINDATFLTYARTRIRGSIIDGFRKEGTIPMHLVRWRKRLTEDKSPCELCKMYHVSEQQLRIIKDAIDGFSIEYVGDDNSRFDPTLLTNMIMCCYVLISIMLCNRFLLKKGHFFICIILNPFLNQELLSTTTVQKQTSVGSKHEPLGN